MKKNYKQNKFDILLKDFDNNYQNFLNYKGEEKFKFGSIYSTKSADKKMAHLVVLIDLFENDNRFYKKFINVVPLSNQIEMATDNDLIISRDRFDEPYIFDFMVHGGIQMTIEYKCLNKYFTHLSNEQSILLKKLLKYVNGDYNIDVSELTIGSPIISEFDYRITYEEELLKDLEYLVIPSFSSMSEMLREYEQDYKWDEEKIFKHNKRNLGLYLDFISNNFRNIDIDKNEKIYYETLIKGYNDFYNDKTNKKLKEKKKLIDATLENMNKKHEGLTESTAELKMQMEKSKKDINKLINPTSSLYEKLKEFNQKGIRTIIPKDPKGPDLIIEHQDGSQDTIQDLNKESKIKLVYLSVDKIKGFSFHRSENHEYYKVLRESIKRDGILKPLDVTPDYELIDGSARLAIAKELNFKEVPATFDYIEKMYVSEFYKYEYNKQIKKSINYIAQGRMNKLFQIINKWENKPLPFSDIKNPYKPTIELIPYYATANIDGLNKVHNDLVDLVKKGLNHIDVDNGILITKGRIFQIEGNYKKAIEQYQELESKHIMNKYKIFTDPLVDCYLNVGDKTSAEYFANKNRSMIIKIAKRARMAPDDTQPWVPEAIKAGEFASA